MGKFCTLVLSPPRWFPFWCGLPLLGALLIALGGRDFAARSADDGAPNSLPPMLSIQWRLGPSMPQGLQDSDGGIVNGTLISVGGFCSGSSQVASKPGKHPRGFLKRTWGIRLDARQQWESLPDFPGVERQGLDAVVVDESIYMWGGFNYTAPFTYQDGYRLSWSAADQKWTWQQLPDLPWPLTAQGSARIGDKIFVVGGADYDGETGFFTQSDRQGKIDRIGARLLILDAANESKPWSEGPSCPGTPRFVHAVAAVRGKLYVFGGASSGKRPADGTFTVVDNWEFDPATNHWTRLADLPVASGNFSSGPIVFEDRYVLLIGGYQYGQVISATGSLSPVYGKPTRHYGDNPMCSDVFVYDVERGEFGRATPLPLNNNLPMAVLRGQELQLLGGEIGSATIDGEEFGHHPDLYLIGTISRVEK